MRAKGARPSLTQHLHEADLCTNRSVSRARTARASAQNGPRELRTNYTVKTSCSVDAGPSGASQAM